MVIIKRDGRKEQFNENKIRKAISKCYLANDEIPDESQINKIITNIKNIDRELSVEEIQNFIINDLEDLDIAKSYEEYRNHRNKIRDFKLNQKFYKAVTELVDRKPNDASKENSNKDATQIHVIRDLMAGETSRKLYSELIMPDKLRELHEKGILHVHDTDYRLQQNESNCELTDLKNALSKGTVMNGKFIEPPKSLRTACTVASQIITAVSSSTYGGQTITMSHLAPFVEVSRVKLYNKYKRWQSFKWLHKLPFIGKYIEKKREISLLAKRDYDLKQEIKDSIQTLLYQLNTISCTNGQSPFITLFLYLDEDPKCKNDTLLLCKEVLYQRIKGMKAPSGHIISPTFPKLVVCLTDKMFTEGTPDYEFAKLCARCVTKRMVPDFISEKNMKALKEGCVIPPMGCRSILHPWKDKDCNYQIYGRNNVGVISINLPYLALESKSIEEFYNKLDGMIDYVSKTQKSIYDVIVDSPVDIAPILYMYGVLDRAKSGTKIKEVIGNRKCSVSIGYMGIAECVERFGIRYNTKEGHDLGISIIKRMFDRTNYNKEKYDIALSLYGTPAESLTTKFAKALEVFPVIPHVNDRTYITNSYHIPVETHIDAFNKMNFESEFQKYSTGGCISYVEVPDVRDNPEAIFELMKHIYEVMVYCEINTTSCSICYNCGFEGEIELSKDGTHCTCPNCGCTDPSKLHVVLRSCGYLGEYSLGTSIGRAGDITNRVKHL